MSRISRHMTCSYSFAGRFYVLIPYFQIEKAGASMGELNSGQVLSMVLLMCALVVPFTFVLYYWGLRRESKRNRGVKDRGL